MDNVQTAKLLIIEYTLVHFDDLPTISAIFSNVQIAISCNA